MYRRDYTEVVSFWDSLKKGFQKVTGINYTGA